MEMLSIHLDRHSDVSLYEQLYIFIKKEIIAERLPYGTKLPSKRSLADFLHISQNTVETTYGQLVAEGYIEAIPRKGFFVQASEDLEYVQKAKDPDPSASAPPRAEIDYHFHPSWIDTEKFPFAQWRKHAKQIIDETNHHLLLHGDAKGELELRQEIAQYLYQARGIRVSADSVIIGAGIEILLQQLLHFIKRDTIFGVEDPGYHLISRLLENYPNKVHPLEVDEAGVQVDKLASKNLNYIYVTPSHHFPYGTVLSVNRRAQLLSWAAEQEDRYIIEDDYDSEFRYSGKSIPALKSMDTEEKVIYLGAFSKSLIPSLRISYMILPEKLLMSYNKELSFYHSSVSRIDQHILASFMSDGDFERHLNRMRKIYRKKLEKVLQLLEDFKPGVKVVGEQSGLHIVLEVQNGMDESMLEAKALEKGLKIYPLSTYSLTNASVGNPKIILGFAGIPYELLEDAIHQLMLAWKIN